MSLPAPIVLLSDTTDGKAGDDLANIEFEYVAADDNILAPGRVINY